MYINMMSCRMYMINSTAPSPTSERPRRPRRCSSAVASFGSASQHFRSEGTLGLKLPKPLIEERC